jgi:hypothetical protein
MLAEMLYSAMCNWIDTKGFGGAEKQKFINTAERIRKYPPNSQFSLVLLGNLAPNHEVFGKDYQKPMKQKETAQLFQIDNSDDFFSSLPPSKSSKKHSMHLGISKQSRQIKKLEAMELAYQHMAGKIALQR